MSNRSQVPRGIKRGEGKPMSEEDFKNSLKPMRFRDGRSKRPDTGKKITKFPSHTPNRK